MRTDEAIGAALLAFVQADEGLSTRERLVAALSAYEAGIAACTACRGSRTLVNHSRSIYAQDGHRASQEPIADGATIACVTCDGLGVDLDQVLWHCDANRYGCRPGSPSEQDHLACGWRRHPESLDRAKEA
jgi:hypothetical protein